MGGRERTCCFTGHRPEKLPWGWDEEDPRCRRLKEKLRDAVETAEAMGVRADVGQVFTADQFYNDNPDAGAMYRKFGILALEMETAGLYWTAQRLGKRALSLLTISDHIFTGESLSAQERQDSFHEMMEIALETAWKSLEG